jgi:hypothetical protein
MIAYRSEPEIINAMPMKNHMMASLGELPLNLLAIIQCRKPA